ncbi:LysR family transcriptional regulator [Tropicibacter naphthalenivorans]|uniref:HTH lysR-type domain-containing protein n=1 Tax=Tropicibacter naphthalenivorans TaxID=441103 RepID=A0A0P1GXV5_9RHOB|nr:LysR family transcriptional regulator [Tropicibacter naphthalenivorans]CUH80501.1 hypothetical protein TRN7648_03017 [Tropicibacter naphthalenivorans]SMC87075.1 DNA-binding transcriptional regulator, LysR family [Tropicibacter naphthalenivorans]
MPPLPLNLDFAALRTLKLVYDLRSFTAAAAQLEVNQSAVSYTIDKLRKAFDDPLFYRQSGRVMPTQRCDQLAAQATEMLDAFVQMAMPDAFDPATAEATVTIASNYYERQIILPSVIRALRAEAPGLRLHLVTATNKGPNLLKTGKADLLMGPITPTEGEFFCQTLLSDEYSCVVAPDARYCADSFDLAAYLACTHVTVTYGYEWRSRYLRELSDAGHTLNTVVEVPSPAGLGLVIEETDLVATVPTRLAVGLEGRLKRLPCPVPAPFDISLVWTTRLHHSPMHAWIRQKIFKLVRSDPFLR